MFSLKIWLKYWYIWSQSTQLNAFNQYSFRWICINAHRTPKQWRFFYKRPFRNAHQFVFILIPFSYDTEHLLNHWHSINFMWMARKKMSHAAIRRHSFMSLVSFFDEWSRHSLQSIHHDVSMPSRTYDAKVSSNNIMWWQCLRWIFF